MSKIRTNGSLSFADTSPSLLPAVVELLYTGRTSLGVDQILEAHNLAKLLGINVTLEHRCVDERRRQVRLEKDGGIFNEDSDEPHGGEVQGQAAEFREPHPPNQNGKMVQSVENNSSSRKPLMGPKQCQSEEGWPRHNRGQRRRQGDPKMRSKTVATDRTSNINSHVGGSQCGGRFVVSRGGDHRHEHHEEGVWYEGCRLPERQNGDHGRGHGKDRSGLQGSNVVTSVGEFSNIILCFLGKNSKKSGFIN